MKQKPKELLTKRDIIKSKMTIDKSFMENVVDNDILEIGKPKELDWEERFKMKFPNTMMLVVTKKGHKDIEIEKELLDFIKQEKQRTRKAVVEDWFKEVKPIILIKDKETDKTIDMLDLVFCGDRIACFHNGKFEYKSTNGKDRTDYLISLQNEK
jgi:hypothetical protein